MAFLGRVLMSWARALVPNGGELAAQAPGGATPAAPPASAADHDVPRAGAACPNKLPKRQIVLFDLPEELLATIAGYAGRDAAPSLAAVCTRLNRAVWGAAPLWRDVRLQMTAAVAAQSGGEQERWLGGLEAWLGPRRRLLGRVAGLVRTVEVLGDEPSCFRGSTPSEAQWASVGALAGTLVSHLAQPGASVECLELRVWGLCLPPAAWEALGRLPRLTTLVLRPPGAFVLPYWGHMRLPPSVAVALRGLPPGLRKLVLCADRAPEAAVPALASLASLTELVLFAREPLPPLAPLSALQALAVLQVGEQDSLEHGVRLPDSATMPRLAAVTVVAPRVQTAGGDVACSCGTGPVKLDALECDCCPNRALRAGQLCMQRGAGLLDVLRTAGVAQGRLENLSLRRCHVWSEGLGAGEAGEGGEAALDAALASCHFVALRACRPVSYEGIAGFLAALLPHLPVLCGLSLSSCKLRITPELAEALDDPLSLSQLRLERCRLRALPGGEYVSGLEELSLRGNRLTAVPPALAAAPFLEYLDLSDNPLVVTQQAADEILLRMPALQVLRLGGTATPAGMLDQLSRQAPYLIVCEDGSDDDSSLDRSFYSDFGEEEEVVSSDEDEDDEWTSEDSDGDEHLSDI